jgi:plasmid maintenance system antidote protein VapI
MNDLTNKEQKAVRTALRFLRLRVGAWGPLAKALRYEWDSIQKVTTGKRAVTPALALRVARLAGVGMDELLVGRWLSARVCRTAATRRTISSTRKRRSSEEVPIVRADASANHAGASSLPERIGSSGANMAHRREFWRLETW